MADLLDMLRTAWPVLLLGITAALCVTLANRAHKHDKSHSKRENTD